MADVANYQELLKVITDGVVSLSVIKRDFNYGKYPELADFFTDDYLDKFHVSVCDVISMLSNFQVVVEELSSPGQDNLLSLDALDWLRSVEYSKKNHEERMMLIKAARLAYP